jgi:hypothetical protein
LTTGGIKIDMRNFNFGMRDRLTFVVLQFYMKPSIAGGISARGSVSFPANTARAANRSWAESPSEGVDTSERSITLAALSRRSYQNASRETFLSG